MDSLTTVYFVSILLTTVAGMGSAFVGSKIYPLSGGALEETTPVPVVTDVQTKEPTSVLSSTEKT
jgi:hypothetical protein